MDSTSVEKNLAKEGEQVSVWNVRPFQLMSLLDMLEKYGYAFYKIGETLEGISTASEAAPKVADDPLPEVNVIGLKERLEAVKDWCTSVGLNMSVRAVNRILELPSDVFKYGTLKIILPELQRRIEDELDAAFFMHVPESKAVFYQNSNLFGEDVVNKFPTTVTDIAEAGSCIATGRFTACVFHLMRIMEIGVQQLGNKLGIQLTEEKNWQNILDGVNKAIRAMKPQTPQEKAERDSYSAASAHLHNVKEAWRNRVMHPKETYTGEEAQAILDNVKTFIVHLSRIL